MIKEILSKLALDEIGFSDVLAQVDSEYNHVPTAFQNGDQYNASTENQGSARVLFYAQLNKLSKEDTLRLFAEHYKNVLDNPGANNHQNIRQFIKNGWAGVKFEGDALLPK